jgi:hypothetical protein
MSPSQSAGPRNRSWRTCRAHRDADIAATMRLAIRRLITGHGWAPAGASPADRAIRSRDSAGGGTRDPSTWSEFPSRFPASQIDHVHRRSTTCRPSANSTPADRVIHRHDANGGCRERCGHVDLQSKCPLFARARFQIRAARTRCPEHARSAGRRDDGLRPRKLADRRHPVAAIERAPCREIDLHDRDPSPSARCYCAIPRPHQP